MSKLKFTIFRKITKRFVIICNLLIAFVFILSSLSNYVNPIHFWIFSILGLSFPYLLLIVVLFLCLWLFFKSKWSLLNITLLILSFQSIKSVFAFHPFSKNFNINVKDSATIRIMQWNTNSFGENEKNRIKGSDIREKMLQYIKDNNADVLCFQEFFDAFDGDFNQNIDYVSKTLGYPNYYYCKDSDKFRWSREKGFEKIGYWGTVIFTKLNFVDSGYIKYPSDKEKTTESLCYIDVLKNNKKIRVFSSHLQSVKFNKLDYLKIDSIKSGEDLNIATPKSIITKIKNAFSFRKQQADMIVDEFKKTNTPFIITGDFNDVPNSYTYSTISNNLQDVFLKKSFGIGRTYNAIAPTLRIDYIFTTQDFDILQYKKENVNLSDHFPIICDVKLKS